MTCKLTGIKIIVNDAFLYRDPNTDFIFVDFPLAKKYFGFNVKKILFECTEADKFEKKRQRRKNARAGAEIKTERKLTQKGEKRNNKQRGNKGKVEREEERERGRKRERAVYGLGRRGLLFYFLCGYKTTTLSV